MPESNFSPKTQEMLERLTLEMFAAVPRLPMLEAVAFGKSLLAALVVAVRERDVRVAETKGPVLDSQFSEAFRQGCNQTTKIIAAAIRAQDYGDLEVK